MMIRWRLYSLVFDKCAVLVFFKSNLKFFLCIHDDGTVPRNRFADRFSGNEKETNSLLFGSHSYFFTVAVEDDCLVSAHAASLEIEIVCADHFISVRIPVWVEVPFPLNHIGKSILPQPDKVSKRGSLRNGYIQVLRVGDNIANRPLHTVYRPAKDLHLDPILEGDLGNLAALHIPVAGIHHLMRSGTVCPELKPQHEILFVALRHLLMDDAAARGHPLHVPGTNNPAVPDAVSMFHLTAKDIGNGLH